MNDTAKITPEQAIINEQKDQILQKFGDAIKFSQEKFNFRTVKELPAGANWPEVKDKNGVALGFKRPSIELPLFRPQLSSLLSILQAGGPEAELILDAVDGVVFKQAYDILSANPTMQPQDFPLEQISLGFIASQPKETKSRGLDGELLEAWAEDYKAVMPELTGKEPARVANAAELFKKKFSSCRSNKDFLQVLRGQLDIYIGNAPRAEEFSDVVEYLDKRLNELLAAVTVAVQDAL